MDRSRSDGNRADDSDQQHDGEREAAPPAQLNAGLAHHQAASQHFHAANTVNLPGVPAAVIAYLQRNSATQRSPAVSAQSPISSNIAYLATHQPPIPDIFSAIHQFSHQPPIPGIFSAIGQYSAASQSFRGNNTIRQPTGSSAVGQHHAAPESEMTLALLQNYIEAQDLQSFPNANPLPIQQPRTANQSFLAAGNAIRQQLVSSAVRQQAVPDSEMTRALMQSLLAAQGSQSFVHANPPPIQQTWPANQQLNLRGGLSPLLHPARGNSELLQLQLRQRIGQHQTMQALTAVRNPTATSTLDNHHFVNVQLPSSNIQRLYQMQQQQESQRNMNDVEEEISVTVQPRMRRRYRTESFPLKLYRMMEETEGSEDDEIVAFNSAGTAIRIIRREDFSQLILPRYFRHSNYTSFKRSLNMYGFRKIANGIDAGAYTHHLFRRGQPELCRQIERTTELELIRTTATRR